MKKCIPLLLLLTLATNAAAQMIVLTPEKAARAKKQTQLRLDYAKTKDYAPYDREYQKAEAKAEQKFFEEKKHNEALAEIEQLLNKNPYCISLLQTKAIMLREMGKTKEADDTRQTWFDIMNSIMASGDGTSCETALQVINTTEEYDVLRIRKWELVSQTLIHRDDHHYDILTVKDKNRPEAEPFEVYFNIDIPFRTLRKMFGK